MKNSKHFDGDAFEFYKKICSKKQDVALSARLLAMNPQIELLFNSYDQHFNANTLEHLNSHGYIDPERKDLKELYDYGSATLQELKVILTTTDSGRIVKCQHCTINDVNTYDHIVPQGDFTEFIVHPRNLICCCSDCNTRKNNRWRTLVNQKTTLNLYLDTLPSFQYLYVTADIGNHAIETTYYLENRDGIDAALFALIENHYTRLNLFKRFSDGTDTVISSLRSILEPLRDFHDLAESKHIILQSIRKEQFAFGINYWQSVLKLELLNSDDFMIDYQ